MSSRSKNIHNATAAEAARLRTAQDRLDRTSKTMGTNGHPKGYAPKEAMRRGIAEAQTGAGAKVGKAKSSRGGGLSPAEAGRGTARVQLDSEDEDDQPPRRISGGNIRQHSATREDAGASRMKKRREVLVSDVEDEDEEEEDEPTKDGKKGERTASDSDEDSQSPEPSPTKNKKTKKKDDDKGRKRRRAEGRLQDKKATAFKKQAQVIVKELVANKVVDPANLWTTDTPRIPAVARALTDYGKHFGVAPVDVEIHLKTYFMCM